MGTAHRSAYTPILHTRCSQQSKNHKKKGGGGLQRRTTDGVGAVLAGGVRGTAAALVFGGRRGRAPPVLRPRDTGMARLGGSSAGKQGLRCRSRRAANAEYLRLPAAGTARTGAAARNRAAPGRFSHGRRWRTSGTGQGRRSCAVGDGGGRWRRGLPPTLTLSRGRGGEFWAWDSVASGLHGPVSLYAVAGYL